MKMTPKIFGFSLIELVIVMTIAAILAGVGFSGYMDNIRVQRRQDAILALQKAYLLIGNAASQPGNSCSSTTCGASACTLDANNHIIFPCTSTNGYYCISYCSTGFSSTSIASTDKQYLTATELLILQAIAITGQGQEKDTPATCRNIYFSDQNNLYPSSCVH